MVHPATDEPRPRGRALLRMQWHELLFIHWPVEARRVQALLPAGVRPDCFDSSAWVGLIPFTMPRFRPLGLRLPGAGAFHECNVRTYVTVEGEPGVWFLSLDAASRLAALAARLCLNLPYHHAEIGLERRGGGVDYKVRRRGEPGARTHLSWEVGDPLPPARPGSLEWFLTERYCLYVPDRRGRLRRGRIWHCRWRLHQARLHYLEDHLLAAAGIEVPGGPASVLSGGVLEAAAWPLRTC